MRHKFQLLVVTLAVFASAYALTVISPLQEAMRNALAMSDNSMALLQGPTRVWPQLIAAVPLGLLIDRYSRVHLLLAFAVLDILGTLATALASSNFALLFAVRSLVGLAGAATLTTAISLLADLYGADQRGRAMMVMGVGQVAGISTAFMLGGHILEHFGSDHDAWKWTLYWLTVPLIAIAVLMLRLHEPARSEVSVSQRSARDSLMEVWLYRAQIMALLGGALVIDIGLGAAYVWAPPALSRGFVLTSARLGEIMGVVFLISGWIGPIIGGALADLCQRTGGPRRTTIVLAMLAIVSAPSGSFALAPSVLLAGALLVVFLTLLPAVSLMVTTLCTVVIPNEIRGLCVALLNAICDVFAFMLAPVVVSVSSGILGGAAMLAEALSITCIGTAIIGAAAFAFAGKYVRQPQTCAKLGGSENCQVIERAQSV